MKPYWKSEKRHLTFLDNKPINYKFLKYFTNNRKKTNCTVFFSCRPLPYILKVACMIKITSFDSPKKARSVFLFFFKLHSFYFEIHLLSLTYQKVSSKNNLHFLVKLPTENSYFRVNIFCSNFP